METRPKHIAELLNKSLELMGEISKSVNVCKPPVGWNVDEALFHPNQLVYDLEASLTRRFSGLKHGDNWWDLPEGSHRLRFVENTADGYASEVCRANFSDGKESNRDLELDHLIQTTCWNCHYPYSEEHERLECDGGLCEACTYEDRIAEFYWQSADRVQEQYLLQNDPNYRISDEEDEFWRESQYQFVVDGIYYDVHDLTSCSGYFVNFR